MYYVLQVAPGAEEKTERWIRRRLDSAIYGRCFHPARMMRKKLRGEWTDVREKLLPGYVFITSEDAGGLYAALRGVPVLTRMLGRDGEAFTALDRNEEEWLRRLLPPEENGTEVELSKVAVDENDRVTILSGPLKGLAGEIKKLHLHRRMAEVEVEFMGRKTILYLGIELVKKE